MAESRPYSKVYYDVLVHPRFRKVVSNPAALGLWLRLLLVSDAMYPIPAPMPRGNRTLRLLIDAGLVIEEEGNTYRMRGQQAERERRSDAARNAAARRWGNAGASDARMPSKSREREEKADANADAPAAFMGFRPRQKAEAPDPHERQAPKHYGQHPGCIVCEPLRQEAERERRKGEA